MKNQRRLAVFSKCADPLLIATNHVLGGLPRGLRRQIGEVTRKFGSRLVRAHRQQDRVRREAIERTLAVKHVLHVSIEIADMDFQINAARKCFRPQERYDRLDRERAQNRQFKFCKREFAASLATQPVESRSHEARRARRGIAPPKLRQPPRGRIESARGDQRVDFGPARRRTTRAGAPRRPAGGGGAGGGEEKKKKKKIWLLIKPKKKKKKNPPS